MYVKLHLRKEDGLRHACMARIGWNCCSDPVDPRDLVGTLALGDGVGTLSVTDTEVAIVPRSQPYRAITLDR